MTAKTLVQRWRDERGQKLAAAVFKRLRRGQTLDGLGLGEHDGRVDLRGIAAPVPTQLRTFEIEGYQVEQFGNLVKLERTRLNSLDLSGSRLEKLMVVNAAIENCRFDGANCREWGLWAVQVTDSSFVGADLRNAVLGPWYQGRGCTYRNVDFSRADMRSIVCSAATFYDCDFADAALVKIDFQSSGFIRCRFRGLLREVMFYDRGFETGKPDANPMEDVDFSEAQLRMVEFRRLNLDRVGLPADPDHLIVHHYRCVLEKAIQTLAHDESERGRGLSAIFGHRLKWAGPKQEVGVFNRLDFVEMGDEEEAEFAVSLLRRLEAQCVAER